MGPNMSPNIGPLARAFFVPARWDVSNACPLVGLSFAATVLWGMLPGEAVGTERVASVALTCGGLWLVARS